MTTDITQAHKKLFAAACDTISTLTMFDDLARKGIVPANQDFVACADKMAEALNIEGGSKSVEFNDLTIMQRDKDLAMQRLQQILFATMCFCRYANYTGPSIADASILRTADYMASALRCFGLRPGMTIQELDIMKLTGPLDVKSSVHLFVSLGDKMKKSLGEGWQSQILQTERGWGLVCSSEHTSEWPTKLLEHEDLNKLHQVSAFLSSTNSEHDGFLAICSYLDSLGFGGQVSENGDSRYYKLPSEEEFLLKTHDFPSDSNLSY